MSSGSLLGHAGLPLPSNVVLNEDVCPQNGVVYTVGPRGLLVPTVLMAVPVGSYITYPRAIDTRDLPAPPLPVLIDAASWPADCTLEQKLPSAGGGLVPPPDHSNSMSQGTGDPDGMPTSIADLVNHACLESSLKKKHCIVSYCRQSYMDKDTSFFRFPREPERCRKWIENLGRFDLLDRSPELMYNSYRLCNRHFEDNQFMNSQNRKRLIWNAVPKKIDMKAHEEVSLTRGGNISPIPSKKSQLDHPNEFLKGYWIKTEIDLDDDQYKDSVETESDDRIQGTRDDSSMTASKVNDVGLLHSENIKLLSSYGQRDDQSNDILSSETFRLEFNETTSSSCRGHKEIQDDQPAEVVSWSDESSLRSCSVHCPNSIPSAEVAGPVLTRHPDEDSTPRKRSKYVVVRHSDGAQIIEAKARLKKSIILIQDDDVCLARAVIVALGKLQSREDFRGFRLFRSRLQYEEALRLHKMAGVPVKRCGLREAAQFERALDVQINIVSLEHSNKVIYSGPPKRRCIYVWQRTSSAGSQLFRYDVISKMSAFLGCKYYCKPCDVGHTRLSDHSKFRDPGGVIRCKLSSLGKHSASKVATKNVKENFDTNNTSVTCDNSVITIKHEPLDISWEPIV